VWSDPQRSEACKGCRKAAKIRAHTPPCAGCRWNPPLMTGNVEAAQLWAHVQTQWRAGGFGPVGLDYPAVRGEARALGILLSHGLMRKMRALELHVLEKRNDQGTIKGRQKDR